MTPTRKQLLSIEWTGRCTGSDLACPACRGVWPQAEGHFVRGRPSRRPGVVYGHAPDCWLATCLAAPPPPQVITDCVVVPDMRGLEPFLAPEPQTPPPADLVALVRRIQEAEADFLASAASGVTLDDARDKLIALRDELLAYPLPAPDRSDR